MWGRSPLGENELELICMGEGPVHGFPLCLSSSLEKGCYKDINIIVYETDYIIIRSRVVPTHFTDGEPYSFALGSPGAKGTFRKLCLGCWETQEPPRGGRKKQKLPGGAAGHCPAHLPTFHSALSSGLPSTNESESVCCNLRHGLSHCFRRFPSLSSASRGSRTECG